MYLVVPALRLEKVVVVSWLSSLLGLSVDDKKPPRRDLMLFDQEVDHVFIWMQSVLAGNVFGRASAQVGKSSCGVLVVEPIGFECR